MQIQPHRRGQIIAFAATKEARSIATQHADLKEKLGRSAYTDEYSREERTAMRETLARLSEQNHRQLGRHLA
mgnify:CR=1 FL=1